VESSPEDDSLVCIESLREINAEAVIPVSVVIVVVVSVVVSVAISVAISVVVPVTVVNALVVVTDPVISELVLFTEQLMVEEFILVVSSMAADAVAVVLSAEPCSDSDPTVNSASLAQPSEADIEKERDGCSVPRSSGLWHGDGFGFWVWSKGG